MQVVYDAKTAQLAHSVPLALLLGALGLQWGTRGGHAAWRQCCRLATLAGWAALQWLLTLLLPAAAGALRVALLGKPCWYLVS